MGTKSKEPAQLRWQRHVEAAQRSGQTLWRYAAEHGLSRGALYAARRRLAHSASAATPSPFAAVRIVATPSAAAPSLAASGAPGRIAGGDCLCARLTDGTQLELMFDAAAAELLVAAIGALMQRGACSASTPA
ncbi:MAG: IS66 family insertion sequence element accessory protein TnpA [bacterium]|jgi:hypothetical protein